MQFSYKQKKNFFNKVNKTDNCWLWHKVRSGNIPKRQLISIYGVSESVYYDIINNKTWK